ncbi:MAG: AIR synthase-related protein, partial [Dehalococcoidales bacterium]
GDLGQVALLDNFCWGDTRRPEMMGALVRAAQACHDMALVYQTPFVSGKDSLNNEFESDGEVVAIPHTLLVSAMAIMADVNRAVSMDFKRSGSLIYAVGATFDELGGSEYLAVHDLIGNTVPKVDPHRSKKVMERLRQTTANGLVLACHDCSDGGLGVAVAEMAFAGGLGATVRLGQVPLGEPVGRDDFILFAESNGRFLVEVCPERRGEFEEKLGDVAWAVVGEVNDTGRLEVLGVAGGSVVSRPIAELKEAWQRPMRW